MPVYPPPSGGSGGGSVTFQDEGSAVGTATILNFVGAGVTATHSGGTVTATIAGGTAAGSLIFLDEGATAGTATHLNVVGSGGTVAYSGGTATLTISAGADDPVADIFGAADTAFEFASSSLAGLTALGTPDVEDADTTVPDHYYIKDDTSGTSWQGRYVAASAAFTAIAKVSGSTMRANFNGVGLFVAQATPGKMSVLEVGTKTRSVNVEIFTNPTTFSSAPVSDITNNVAFPFYLGIVATTTTDVAYYFSMNGRVWMRILTGHDPSMTIGAVGFAAKSENTNGHAASFEFFRIWNSAKTFPG